MTILGEQRVRDLLRQWIEPCQQQDPISGGMLKRLKVDGDTVTVALTLGFPADDYRHHAGDALSAYLRRHLPNIRLDLRVDWAVRAHRVQGELDPLPAVRNIIAVASGKGGVGKSTTTANLALALAAQGARVGILDADLYGPSQPRMLGVNGQPVSDDGKHMQPLEAHGLQIMSAGFLVEEDAPVIWRGSMVSKALAQLIKNTRWRDLDYLLVDLPPGTGDIQLTLAQQIPVSGALIVTTPQDIALLDARKGLRMFEKTGIPVLGLIENMSTHICSQCGHHEAIFGEGGGERLAAEHEVALLGRLPLDIRIRAQADGGRPTVLAEPNGTVAGLYRDIARRAAARLAARELDRQARYPRIAVVSA